MGVRDVYARGTKRSEADRGRQADTRRRSSRSVDLGETIVFLREDHFTCTLAFRKGISRKNPGAPDGLTAWAPREGWTMEPKWKPTMHVEVAGNVGDVVKVVSLKGVEKYVRLVTQELPEDEWLVEEIDQKAMDAWRWRDDVGVIAPGLARLDLRYIAEMYAKGTRVDWDSIAPESLAWGIKNGWLDEERQLTRP